MLTLPDRLAELHYHDYLFAQPFPHMVIDNAIDPVLLRQASHDMPPAEWEHWVRYQNNIEHKLACPQIRLLPQSCQRVLFELNSVTRELNRLTGLDLLADPTLHGGGPHVMHPGSKLDMHLDCDRHPQFGVHRQLNLILYANPRWKHEWGGNLELWDAEMSAAQVSIAPLFNRLVIFETSDKSYHGVPGPVRCPEGETRTSFAVYYWNDIEFETQRPRAKFVARPGDSRDLKLEAFRKERAGL